MTTDNRMNTQRYISHIDMDAFFVSVEQLENPELRGRPVVVGGSPFKWRSVVSAASYEAREYGIHSAMSTKQAYRLCPDAVFCRPRFHRYEYFSKMVFAILRKYSPLVEPASIDEAYIDLTGTERLFGAPESTARKIKSGILDETGLVASVGLAPNKMLAKIASDFDKPDGFVVIAHDGIRAFLDPLPVKKLPGIGPKFVMQLDKIGIHKGADVLSFQEEDLIKAFGKAGEYLYRLARGIDDRPVEPSYERKQISIERTFPEDVSDWEVIKKLMLAICDKLGVKMKKKHIVGRTINVKIRYPDFRTITRAETLMTPTRSPQKIFDTAQKLAAPEIRERSLRLFGIGVSNLSHEEQRPQELFSSEDPKEEQLIEVLMKIREKYGSDKIFRASIQTE